MSSRSDKPLLSAVLTDWDDTVCYGDGAELHARLCAVNEELGMGFSVDEITAQYLPIQNLNVTRARMVAASRARGSTVTEEAWTRANRAAVGRFDHHFHLAEGVPACFAYLRDARVLTGIVSTRGRFSLEHCISIFDLHGTFPLTITPDDCAETKPHPRPLLLALERLGVSASNALYIGDRPDTDIPAARAAGMHSILVGGRPLDDMRPTHHVMSFADVLPTLRENYRLGPFAEFR